MAIHYSAGNEHSPTDRAGRVSVELEEDGTLRVSHHAWLSGQRRIWSARVEPTVVSDILAAMAEARFPTQPDLHLLPDERARVLHIPGTGTVILPWDAALTLPGYADTFQWLDALIASAMTQPTSEPAEPAPPPVP